MSLSDVSTNGLKYIVSEMNAVKDDVQFERLLNSFRAELDKRDRFASTRETTHYKAPPAKPLYTLLDEMPYGQFQGSKITGIPADVLENELVRLQGLGILTTMDENLLGTIRYVLNWRANKEPISRMPFGQHKGKPFDEVPTDWLEWIVDKTSKPGENALSEDLKSAILESLAKRKATH